MWRVARCRAGHLFVTRSDVDEAGKLIICPHCGDMVWCVMVKGPFRRRREAEAWLAARGRRTLAGLLAELDWAEVLRHAIYEGTLRSAWRHDPPPVVEWRNAADSIYLAVLEGLRRRGLNPYRLVVAEDG